MNTGARVIIGLVALMSPLLCAAQASMQWREVPEQNLVYLELMPGAGESRLVVIELNPLFAPRTVDQFKRLVSEDFYRGLSFYRVIDGFVAQGGDMSDIDVPNGQPGLPAEFEIGRDTEMSWTPVQRDDLFAPETGFVDGFAAARDAGSAWLTHCPGVVAMARGEAPGSGSTDFYIVIGQAPRYLDRNLTVFGRVIHGMDAVQRISRGPTEENGIIGDELARARIRRMSLGTEVEPEMRKAFYVMDTGSEGFAEFMAMRRARSDAFFHHKPPPVLDVCQVPVGTRVEKPSTPSQPLPD